MIPTFALACKLHSHMNKTFNNDILTKQKEADAFYLTSLESFFLLNTKTVLLLLTVREKFRLWMISSKNMQRSSYTEVIVKAHRAVTQNRKRCLWASNQQRIFRYWQASSMWVSKHEWVTADCSCVLTINAPVISLLANDPSPLV